MTEATDRREVNRLTADDFAEVEVAARRILDADPAVADAGELLDAALRRTANFRVTRFDLRDAEIEALLLKVAEILAFARAVRALGYTGTLALAADRFDRDDDCANCGRPVLWDEGTLRYRHGENPANGCFLIAPEGMEA